MIIKTWSQIMIQYYFQNEQLGVINDDILSIGDSLNDTFDLIVTSPPYNVDIQYNSHDDDQSYEEYKKFSRDWLTVCYQVLKDDGRFCLNVPLDKNKGGQQSVGADFTTIAKSVGFNYHSTIVWNEGNISRRTAWGSWMSASSPYVIAPVELIIVLYKKQWKKNNREGISDITKEEFMAWTNGLWEFNGESKKRIGHPAPFPLELPKRCIKLFSYVGDKVFDPFMGSGTTLISAAQHNRYAVGVDLDKDYCDLAINRMRDTLNWDQPELIPSFLYTEK